jgi:tRNA(Ile)-lysidine synthase
MSSVPFLEKLSAGLKDLSPKTKVLVGVSGGRDSMCLLHGLLMLGYRKLVVCHFNHQLRGRSAQADENFVRRQAKNLQFESSYADTRVFATVRKISLETAGRILRYAFFVDVAKRTRCRTLLLAHHADDQLETCWLNFLRGTGIAGLAGMRRESVYKTKKCSLRIVRPFLQVLRSEIMEFTHDQKIPFREDATNLDVSFTRNRIRRELLPFIDQKFGTAHREAV